MTTRALRVPTAVSALLLLAGVVLAMMPASAAVPDTRTGVVQVGREGADPGFTATKTLTRTFVEDDGSTYSFPSNTVTVTASQTKNLRGRQRILISWTGAQPSGGRASNPYGEAGLQQEYPVVILQCRGTDDASLPADQQVAPQTCWTNSFSQRSQVLKNDGDAVWTKDPLEPDADRQRISGVDPFPGKDVCANADQDPLYTHLTPFVAASGKVFPACDASTMPPEAAVGAAFPPAEIAAFSDADGAGSVQFEVRSDVENESLGCSDTTACSIVVIPINGLSCAQGATPPSIADTTCRKGGQFSPGSSNFQGAGVDLSASPALWWSGTNWSNRISIPITMGLPPDTCDILDPRPPTGFYGSELMAQAALQWSPAYCLNKKRFKFQLNQMSDAAGWNLMEGGGGAAAFVSSAHKKRSDDPVGYAPTALTGFAIGYNIDKPDNQGEYSSLRLDQRLVAKLLTQSYTGSALGRTHPGMENNPDGIQADPEFQELNPGLDTSGTETGAALLNLANDSDVVEQLTEWIAQDPSAMDFIKGKPDPWGMRVNPSYKDVTMPRSEWPLLDDFIPPSPNTCRQANPAVYSNQLAAPVTTLRKIAEALLDGWPNTQTRCDFDPATNLWKLGRIDRQNFGGRFMLGVVSLGDAARYGLRAAALQTKSGSYVGPTEDSLRAAVDLMQLREPGKGGKGGKGGGGKGGGKGDGGAGQRRSSDKAPDLSGLQEPFVLDQDDVRKSTGAYPGTMIVYTAAKLQDLVQDDADKVALFIRTATSEGQREGSGNGELPGGFVPIEKSGSTRKLYALAQDVADAVEAQTPEPTEEPSPTASASPTADPTLPGGTVTNEPLPDVPSDDVPSEAPSDAASPAAASASAAPVVMPQTEAVSSDLGNRTVPVLLLLGLVGIALTTAVRFFVRPPRGPVR
ncbi:hypothetical protein G5V58_04420 [Nocardioides anomalus]|uniref:PBP domain-containing protein n=1 Tax=Nocardioides anomalus TaxID=2712223 RepID=A0A6G6WAI5_9ACTN|nr:hypothetical protein [Nocardioides anomalus]QIG42115.1 hypothetical protein G5V58_04420 [Nocardioides anomalus]